MPHITPHTINVAALLAQVQTTAAGAVVLFLGTTREFTQGKQTRTLFYECYESMALKKIAELEQEARIRWQLEKCEVVHRVGEVPLGEASVAIAVSAGHRAAAFEAGQWLIDTLKQVVPIWKEEHWATGEREWVHPPACQEPTP
jgi:molybdopterin synthase catalytic subunit